MASARNDSTANKRRALTGFSLLLALCSGCAREPLDATCSDLREGDLVITEIRGPQSGADTYGEWIELLNTRDAETELTELSIRMVPIDGREPQFILVRDEGLTVAPGGYVVIGLQDSNNLPDHVDYGFRLTSDTKGLFSSAFVEVSMCGEVIDELLYPDLPDSGSWALDGNIKPSSTANDDFTAFCVDDADAPPGPATDLGQPGSPGEANKPCVGP
ncbi:MAG: lamin tail domain-containing protein [Nannocystaceae bacterium]|nr:lamin tail domain-containing protein [Nannocystaceae bacterium]